MKDLSITNPIKQIIRYISRFSLIIFIILASIGIIVSFLILNSILNGSPINILSNTTSKSFDQPTINQLNKLEPSTKNNNYKNLPSGRINPFAE
jgi:hypothetical protein